MQLARTAAGGFDAGAPRVLAALVGLLGAAVLAFLCCGAVVVPPGDLFAMALGWLAGGESAPAGLPAAIVALRLPRLAVGVATGAALATSGAALQALFRNPLVDPGLIGIAAGAALAAAAATVLGDRLLPGMRLEPLFLFGLQAAAFAGALLAAAAVYALGRRRGEVDVAAMLLAGVAVTALAGALTGVLIFVATDAQLRSLLFWNLGSLGNAGWHHVGVALLIAPALLLLWREAPALDALLLGEAPARLLGVDVRALQRRVVALTAFAVGAVVAITGVVGFVGLVVPHVLRPLLGAGHRLLLPASAGLGAALVLAADTAARTIAAPAELPLGVVTALIGAPFFLWLLRRRGAGPEPA